jgi:hypothetical protein
MSSEQKQNYKEYSDLIKTNIENKKEDEGPTERHELNRNI